MTQTTFARSPWWLGRLVLRGFLGLGYQFSAECPIVSCDIIEDYGDRLRRAAAQFNERVNDSLGCLTLPSRLVHAAPASRSESWLSDAGARRENWRDGGTGNPPVL